MCRQEVKTAINGLREPSRAIYEQEVKPAVATCKDGQEERKSLDSEMEWNSNLENRRYSSDECSGVGDEDKGVWASMDWTINNHTKA